MSGDLSITPQRSGRDLAAAAGATRAPVARPSAPDGVGVAALSPQQGVAADASQQIEAAHLRTLLTDPAMRVSTHQDEASGRTILQVRSRATGEVIEQIPSEALLRLYAAMREPLVDERA
jgi:hypothetical protein